jgi:2-aminoadipate transaminase
MPNSEAIGMVDQIQLDASLEQPLYRQLADHIRQLIENKQLRQGDRLPATRELSQSLGLNRNTIQTAYGLLESSGLVHSEIGRGSFVSGQAAPAAEISFATSRPRSDLFPMDDFNSSVEEVLRGEEARELLQLGSPGGYAPLRRYLLEQARREGTAQDSDDILITSGCQQALDLLQRTFAPAGSTVIAEDPVYPGLRNVFERAGVRLIGLSQSNLSGHLAAAIANEKPALVLLTPSFQNPTGSTLNEAERRALARILKQSNTLLAEIDLYSGLRYRGEALPTLRALEPGLHSLLLRSFSKVAFPGLRVGYLLGPSREVRQLIETRHWVDLHSDQFSQAVLLRFAESGRLAQHQKRMVEAGRLALDAALEACERELPASVHFTRPEGGMNLWLTLPAGMNAEALLPRARQLGINYLPGRFFALQAAADHALRLSFAGLEPAHIREGIARLSKVIREELDRRARNASPDLDLAIV